MAEDPRIVFSFCAFDFDTFFGMTCLPMVPSFVDQTAGPLGTVGLGSCNQKFFQLIHVIRTISLGIMTIILHKNFNNTYPLAAKLAVNVINSCDNVASWLEKDVNGVSNSGAKGSPNTSGKKDP